MGHIFPQGVLAATAWVGGRAGEGGARAGASCEQGCLLCSVAISPYWGHGQGPRCWCRSPEGQVQAGSIPSKCVPSPQQQHLHPSGEQHCSKTGWRRCPLWAGVRSGTVPASPSEPWSLLICCLCTLATYRSPHPIGGRARFKPSSSPQACSLLSNGSLCPGGQLRQSQEWLGRLPLWAGVRRKLARARGRFPSASSALLPGLSTSMCALFKGGV